jgi:CRP-like cAMP-binding protein
VLEVRRADLVVAAAQHDGVSQALRQFTRERFLRNLTATHPFFQLLDKDDRHRVMEVTHVMTFKAGDVLIEEGRRGPGLFVLLGGQALVKKKLNRGDDVEFIHLATLRGSDLCGEMSMLTDAPTNATVTCSEDLEALFLSRDAFKSVTAEHPELLRYLANVTDERLRHNRALLVGRALLEDDEHVMI